MRRTAAIATGVLLAAGARAQNIDGVVQWGIQKRHSTAKLTKRGTPVNEAIANDESMGGYFANCKLGTPAQELTLQLDTGSSDIWVPESSSKVCEQSSSSPGCNLGSFTPSKSSTFDDFAKGEFDIEYVDGSHSKGDYFGDVFEIGGVSLTNLTMGLGINTDINYGLVGIGYASDEASVGDQAAPLLQSYPNLPVAMVNEGLINSVAYSLWLNDLDSSSGQILFGGIDTAKYHGDLTRISIYQDPTTGTFSSFMVALTSLDAVSSSGQDGLTSPDYPIPVVLDSGTTLSYVPTDLAEQVWQEAGAMYSSSVGIAIIPCDLSNSKGYFSFGFAGPEGPRVNVTMDELVLPLTDDASQAPTFSSGPYAGQTACEFGIQNFSSPPYLLGDTFLRSAYVVYDLVNNEIGIAATDFNATDSNVVAFPSSGAPIPSATTAPDQAAVTDRPAVTSPAYAAQSGFADTSASSSNGSDGETGLGTTSGEKNAGTMLRAFDLAQVSVVSVSMALMMVGSGIFVLL